MFNLNIPQPNTASLFNGGGARGLVDTAYLGYGRGRELAGNSRKDELRRKLGELVQRHDITTPQGKLSLVKELSESGLGEDVMGLQKDFQGGAGQVLDTPDGYQVADPTYGRAHPMTGGLMGKGAGPQGEGGAGMRSHQSQQRIDDNELREGFAVWKDKIAKPLGEANGYNFTEGDINRLRSTLPKELEGYGPAEDFFRTIKPVTPARPRGGSGSGFNPSGITRNIEDIDSELGRLEQELSDLGTSKPTGDFRASKEWSEKRFKLQNQITKLRQERRRYQARGPLKGSGPGAGPRKLEDPNKAREYLRRANGDKEKARELARRDGWAF